MLTLNENFLSDFKDALSVGVDEKYDEISAYFIDGFWKVVLVSLLEKTAGFQNWFPDTQCM